MDCVINNVGGDIDDGSGLPTSVVYPGNLFWFVIYYTYMYYNVTGIDYDTGPYTVTFPIGATRSVLRIPLNNDNLVESAENFTLSINPSSLPFGVKVNNRNQSVVTIYDDDCKFE